MTEFLKSIRFQFNEVDIDINALELILASFTGVMIIILPLTLKAILRAFI